MPILEARTEDEFNRLWTALKQSTFRNRDAMVKYLEDTWYGYRHMFVKAWTNNVLHFGNTTNCRLESAHNALKHWLTGGRGNLLHVWKKTHLQNESNITKVKYYLEHSRRRFVATNTRVTFKNLNGRVSHYCLELLDSEVARMRELGDDVHDRCGCVLWTTHGIPCACSLRNFIDSNAPVMDTNIHPFWRILRYGNEEQGSNQAQAEDGVSDDIRAWREAASRVEQRDPIFIRQMTASTNEQLSPERAWFEEPETVVNTRGRPRQGNSTRRAPSSFEYTSRPRRRSSLSGSQSSAASHPLYNSVCRTIRSYVQTITDVRGDGNCGFRVVASVVYGNEEHWRLVRDRLADHLELHQSVYQIPIFLTPVNQALRRLRVYDSPCSEDEWMVSTDDLWLIAQAFNAAVMYFHPSYAGCVTILPMWALPGIRQPAYEIQIMHTEQHYFRLHLLDDSPVPAIAHWWFDRAHPEMAEWAHVYRERIRMWQSLGE